MDSLNVRIGLKKTIFFYILLLLIKIKCIKIAKIILSKKNIFITMVNGKKQSGIKLKELKI